MYNIAIMLSVMTFHSCQTYWSCPIRSFQSEVGGRWGIISAWMNHLLKGIPVSPSQSCYQFRSTPPRQKTRQVKASAAPVKALAKRFLILFTSQRFTFFHLQPRVKSWTARRTRSVNTPARESTTARVFQASTVTTVKVLCSWPGWCSLQAAGQVERQTGVFEEELCYPTGIWIPALEEAAVMMDYCNYQNWHGLAQFITGTSRLMLWIIVL